MKRNLSLVLVLTMLTAMFSVSAFAADNTGLEKSILSIKERISVPEEYTEFNSDTRTDDNQTEYNLYWSTPYEEYTVQKDISVTVNDKGDITSYSKSFDWDEAEPGFGALSEEEIKKSAINWLSNVNPGWMAELPEDKTSAYACGVFERNGRVRFDRYVNGLDFCGNGVNVTVDINSGEVINMYADWTYADAVPAADKVISAEDAGKLFLENSPMELKYIRNADTDKAIPVYMPKNTSYRIDAQNGEEFKEFSYYGSYAYSGGGAEKNEAAMESAADRGLTDAEIENLNDVEGLLPKSKLRSIAEGLENTGIKSAEFKSLSYSRDRIFRSNDSEEKPDYTAELRYIGKDINYDICLNALTGELLSFYSYDMTTYPDREDKDSKIDYETALKSAREFADKYSRCGEKIKLEEPENKENRKQNYYINFVRYENDIKFEENNVFITVDNNTGMVRSYSKYWDKDIEFESADGIISAEKAAEILLEKTGMELTYAKQQGESKTVPQIGLVYSLSTELPSVIDAKTGIILSYDGTEYTPGEDKTVYPEDVSGHYAEDKINKLIESGVLRLNEGDTKFRPDDVITIKELLAFVSGLKTGYIPYYDTVDSIAKVSRRWGILKDESVDLDSAAERQNGAEYIVRALGYSRIAELKGIFTTGFADDFAITDDMKGYVAIAKGLNIVGGDENGCFNPNSALTRADAAIMIYNYLAK